MSPSANQEIAVRRECMKVERSELCVLLSHVFNTHGSYILWMAVKEQAQATIKMDDQKTDTP